MYKLSQQKKITFIGTKSFEYTCYDYLLFLEGDLYAAAPLQYDGSSLQFRRKAGSRANVWMYDKWVLGQYAALLIQYIYIVLLMLHQIFNKYPLPISSSVVTEPTFVGASWVKRKQDPDNEKIYIFFREKNPDSSPEAGPWITRVARVCKVMGNRK